jgi:hypothetical protein
MLSLFSILGLQARGWDAYSSRVVLGQVGPCAISTWHHNAFIDIILLNATSSIRVALLESPDVCLIRDIIISINGSSNTVADDFHRGLLITLSRRLV